MNKFKIQDLTINSYPNKSIAFFCKKKVCLLIFCLVSLTMSSCGDIPEKTYYLAKREAAKSTPTYTQFQELCNAKDRTIINKSAEVDGYLFASNRGASCTDGWGGILESGYDFFECTPNAFSDIKELTAVGITIYRYSINDVGHEDCVSVNDLVPVVRNKYSKEKYRNKLEREGKCLAKRKVNGLKSEFADILEFGAINGKGEHVLTDRQSNIVKETEISFYGYHVIDLKNNETLAMSRYYTYVPYGEHVDAIGKFTCEKESGGFGKVLKPKSD